MISTEDTVWIEQLPQSSNNNNAISKGVNSAQKSINEAPTTSEKKCEESELLINKNNGTPIITVAIDSDNTVTSWERPTIYPDAKEWGHSEYTESSRADDEDFDDDVDDDDVVEEEGSSTATTIATSTISDPHGNLHLQSRGVKWPISSVVDGTIDPTTATIVAAVRAISRVAEETVKNNLDEIESSVSETQDKQSVNIKSEKNNDFSGRIAHDAVESADINVQHVQPFSDGELSTNKSSNSVDIENLNTSGQFNEPNKKSNVQNKNEMIELSDAKSSNNMVWITQPSDSDGCRLLEQNVILHQSANNITQTNNANTNKSVNEPETKETTTIAPNQQLANILQDLNRFDEEYQRSRAKLTDQVHGSVTENKISEISKKTEEKDNGVEVIDDVYSSNKGVSTLNADETCSVELKLDVADAKRSTIEESRDTVEKKLNKIENDNIVATVEIEKSEIKKNLTEQIIPSSSDSKIKDDKIGIVWVTENGENCAAVEGAQPTSHTPISSSTNTTEANILNGNRLVEGNKDEEGLQQLCSEKDDNSNKNLKSKLNQGDIVWITQNNQHCAPVEDIQPTSHTVIEEKIPSSNTTDVKNLGDNQFMEEKDQQPIHFGKGENNSNCDVDNNQSDEAEKGLICETNNSNNNKLQSNIQGANNAFKGSETNIVASNTSNESKENEPTETVSKSNKVHFLIPGDNNATPQRQQKADEDYSDIIDEYERNLRRHTCETLELVDKLCEQSTAQQQNDDRQKRSVECSNGESANVASAQRIQWNGELFGSAQNANNFDLEIDSLRINPTLMVDPIDCIVLPKHRLVILDNELGILLVDLKTKNVLRSSEAPQSTTTKWRYPKCGAYIAETDHILVLAECCCIAMPKPEELKQENSIPSEIPTLASLLEPKSTDYNLFICRFDAKTLRLENRVEAPKFIREKIVSHCHLCYAVPTKCIYLAVNTPNDAFLYELNESCCWSEVYNRRGRTFTDLVFFAVIGPVTELLVLETNKQHVLLLSVYDSEVVTQKMVAVSEKPNALTVDEDGAVFAFDRATSRIAQHSRLHFDRLRDIALIERAHCRLSACDHLLAVLVRGFKQLKLHKY